MNNLVKEQRTLDELEARARGEWSERKTQLEKADKALQLILRLRSESATPQVWRIYEPTQSEENLHACGLSSYFTTKELAQQCLDEFAEEYPEACKDLKYEIIAVPLETLDYYDTYHMDRF